MELTPLRYALALDRERHFQRAAERVHVSQPTLSQGIMNLEREIGVRLFERSPRHVRPTAAGARFLARLREILSHLDEAVEETRDPAQAPAGLLTVAAIPTIGPYVLADILKDLKARAPRLKLELQEWTTSVLVQRLKEGRLDIGILSLPIPDKTLVARSLGDEEFRLAVPKGHPLAKKKEVRPRDLEQERLLILHEGHCFRDQSLAFCRRAADDPQVVFQGSSLGSVLRLAAAGEGVTLVPAMAAEPRPGMAFLRFAAP